MKYYIDKHRHVICVPYSVENLHLMAKDLNINRCWFHKAKYPHYDAPKRRKQELEEKCILVSSKEIVKLCRGEKDDKIC